MLAPDGFRPHDPASDSSLADATPQLRADVLRVWPHVRVLHEAASPSLHGREVPAFELKFLLDEATAGEVEARLRPALSLDPHGSSACGGGYQLATLYFDTQRLDMYRRVGRHKFFKCRLRRYDGADRIYLERKSKRGDRVHKRRSAIDLDQLSCFAQPNSANEWAGDWYQRQLVRHELQPVCLIEYRRIAYFAARGEGPVRLTFDREIRGGLTADWSFAAPHQRQRLLANFVVCEFKFRGSLPASFKTVLHDLQLAPQGVSKYRQCMMASGAAGNGSADHA